MSSKAFCTSKSGFASRSQEVVPFVVCRAVLWNRVALQARHISEGSCKIIYVQHPPRWHTEISENPNTQRKLLYQVLGCHFDGTSRAIPSFLCLYCLVDWCWDVHFEGMHRAIPPFLRLWSLVGMTWGSHFRWNVSCNSFDFMSLKAFLYECLQEILSFYAL